jgi:hypothetical protein
LLLVLLGVDLCLLRLRLCLLLLGELGVVLEVKLLLGVLGVLVVLMGAVGVGLLLGLRLGLVVTVSSRRGRVVVLLLGGPESRGIGVDTGRVLRMELRVGVCCRLLRVGGVVRVVLLVVLGRSHVLLVVRVRRCQVMLVLEGGHVLLVLKGRQVVLPVQVVGQVGMGVAVGRGRRRQTRGSSGCRRRRMTAAGRGVVRQDLVMVDVVDERRGVGVVLVKLLHVDFVHG